MHCQGASAGVEKLDNVSAMKSILWNPAAIYQLRSYKHSCKDRTNTNNATSMRVTTQHPWWHPFAWLHRVLFQARPVMTEAEIITLCWLNSGWYSSKQYQHCSVQAIILEREKSTVGKFIVLLPSLRMSPKEQLCHGKRTVLSPSREIMNPKKVRLEIWNVHSLD